MSCPMSLLCPVTPELRHLPLDPSSANATNELLLCESHPILTYLSHADCRVGQLRPAHLSCLRKERKRKGKSMRLGIILEASVLRRSLTSCLWFCCGRSLAKRWEGDLQELPTGSWLSILSVYLFLAVAFGLHKTAPHTMVCLHRGLRHGLRPVVGLWHRGW